ncbi:hypothetical protein, partial [Staphylococcus aureus]|uniref:hypothetical protein n=1 Tax=Staphylococcus aureus TaxID=1280 RepID=UPI00301CCFC1
LYRHFDVHLLLRVVLMIEDYSLNYLWSSVDAQINCHYSYLTNNERRMNMKEFKGTPGPWYRGGIENGKLSINAGKYFVALVDQGLAQKSNASLISSAPDLLEALQEMTAIVKKNSYPQPDKPSSNYARAEWAESIISKALGE